MILWRISKSCVVTFPWKSGSSLVAAGAPLWRWSTPRLTQTGSKLSSCVVYLPFVGNHDFTSVNVYYVLYFMMHNYYGTLCYCETFMKVKKSLWLKRFSACIFLCLPESSCWDKFCYQHRCTLPPSSYYNHLNLSKMHWRVVLRPTLRCGNWRRLPLVPDTWTVNSVIIRHRMHWWLESHWISGCYKIEYK